MAERALAVLAAVLVASMAVAAWHDTSKAWDVWYYHLPFAGRLVGLVDAQSFAFGRANQARYDGFPLFGELVQGLLWRITGRIECASFLSLVAVPGLAWAMRKLFAVPLPLTVLALLAVPLVQIHATGCYVDLPANTCVALLFLLVYRCVRDDVAPSLRVMLGAAALAIAAANTKFQLVPAVLVASIGLVVVALRKDAKRTHRVLVIAGALPLVFFTPLKNLVRWGNPVWPVELRLLGHTFPFREGAYASSPDWLARSPGPVRWLASIFELANHPITEHARWSLDQWTPPRDPAYRMGGFFGAYVAVNLLALVVAALRQRTRESRVALAFAAGASLVASVMPQSHELRYYMFWMILLVALNLTLWSRVRPLMTAGVAVVALAITSWSTGFGYLYASGDSFATLATDHVDEAALGRVKPGERTCIMHAPWTFLYAPRFHPGHDYRVQEAEDETECDGARSLE